MNRMKMENKRNLFGILYSVTDYEKATHEIIANALRNTSFGVSALAVHGLVTAYRDSHLKAMVNSIDMVTPDGQPVRWALNSFHKAGLKERVSGPDLTLRVLDEANKNKLRVYLYGSTRQICDRFSGFIRATYPHINLCGVHVDRFREATPEEDAADIEEINSTKAQIVLVGRGCPRQEVWVANHLGKIHASMLAVGAAFDFHAGRLRKAPRWIQHAGLEWCYRLAQDPRRLWRRYLITNSIFIFLFLKHKILATKL